MHAFQFQIRIGAGCQGFPFLIAREIEASRVSVGQTLLVRAARLPGRVSEDATLVNSLARNYAFYPRKRTLHTMLCVRFNTCTVRRAFHEPALHPATNIILLTWRFFFTRTKVRTILRRSILLYKYACRYSLYLTHPTNLSSNTITINSAELKYDGRFNELPRELSSAAPYASVGFRY